MIGILGITGAAYAMALAGQSDGSASIAGAINKPGIVAVSGPQSLHEVLKKNGGLRPDADKRRITIVAKDGAARTVDLTELGRIPAIQPGDRVVVPTVDPSKSILVQGGVQRAGAFDFKPGLSLRELVAQAVPTQTAHLEKIRIYRADKSGTVEVHTANLLAMNGTPAELRPGDTVVVPHTKTQMSDRDLITIVVVGLLILVLID